VVTAASGNISARHKNGAFALGYSPRQVAPRWRGGFLPNRRSGVPAQPPGLRAFLFGLQVDRHNPSTWTPGLRALILG
jgi:hypothetical protein